MKDINVPRLLSKLAAASLIIAAAGIGFPLLFSWESILMIPALIASWTLFVYVNYTLCVSIAKELIR